MQLVSKTHSCDPHLFRCGSGSSIFGQCGSGFGSRGLMTQNFKILQLKKNLYFLKIKNSNLLFSLGLQRKSKQQDKSSSLGRQKSATLLKKTVGKVELEELSLCEGEVRNRNKSSSNAVLRIHDILMWIRIRIRGSMPLTNG
jgi:hypothetical protein